MERCLNWMCCRPQSMHGATHVWRHLERGLVHEGRFLPAQREHHALCPLDLCSQGLSVRALHLQEAGDVEAACHRLRL